MELKKVGVWEMIQTQFTPEHKVWTCLLNGHKIGEVFQFAPQADIRGRFGFADGTENETNIGAYSAGVAFLKLKKKIVARMFGLKKSEVSA